MGIKIICNFYQIFKYFFFINLHDINKSNFVLML